MVTDVAIVGGGIGGLASALLLGRQGCRVVLCERDPAPVPPTPEEMWSGWQRAGIPQWRLGHTFLPGFRVLLAERAPDVLERLRAAGAPLDGLLGLDARRRTPPRGRRDVRDHVPSPRARGHPATGRGSRANRHRPVGMRRGRARGRGIRHAGRPPRGRAPHPRRQLDPGGQRRHLGWPAPTCAALARGDRRATSRRVLRRVRSRVLHALLPHPASPRRGSSCLDSAHGRARNGLAEVRDLRG